MPVTEDQLDQWVRGNWSVAQSWIVELVARLVAASVPQPQARRFPLSVGQHGPDGYLEVTLGLGPHVPDGKSYWEIGTNAGAARKASDDYRDLTKVTPPDVMRDSTFIFVTPLSGRKDWAGTWKADGQLAWRRRRLNKNEWKDVRVIDGTQLVDWLSRFPAVDAWAASKLLGIPTTDFEAPSQCWDWLSSIGDPPPLTTNLFLAGRDEACGKLRDVLEDRANHLRLETHFPDQVTHFVASYIASLPEAQQFDAAGRCVLVSSEAAWMAIASLPERHCIVASQQLDLTGPDGMRLIAIARRGRHATVFGAPRGGNSQPASARLPNPSVDQMREALVQASYPNERARLLGLQSRGSLSSLLRCIQDHSVTPEWAEGTAASELAICSLIGQWDDASAADRAVVESISGKIYGEWIAAVREAARHPGTPLIHREGTWRFVGRYEGWQVLGARLFDEHLDRFLAVAKNVFSEDHPGLTLPIGERYLAPVRDLKLQHSALLRRGLADGLALLGSHPTALSSCSAGKAEVTAVLAVRDVLGDSSWQHWATLDRLLPLFAEAAPGEFLATLSKATTSDGAPFEALFAQDGEAITGSNYVSGTLWALETLAWSPDLLGRVVLCLGDLASRDPGGKWANRPANSLATIFLPWFPQTAATKEKQRSAIDALADEYPAVAWKLLLALLPDTHSSSMGSAKPSWRDYIPEDWSEGTTRGERWSQEEYFAKAALSLAGNNPLKLAELVDHIARLPEDAFTALLDRLTSADVVGLPETDRVGLWQSVANVAVTHQKFADADWVMPRERLAAVTAAAERLAPETPLLRHRRLFTEKSFQLYEATGDYDKQQALLEQRRRKAVREVAADGGLAAVLELARSVDSPWLVGIAHGTIGNRAADRTFLPHMLASEERPVFQFIGGYVGSRFHAKGWGWVDTLRLGKWTLQQQGAFLALLPFGEETWARAAVVMGADQQAYWSSTDASPYRAKGGLAIGVDRLLDYGRPYSALHCLHWMLHDKQAVDGARAVRALMAALGSSEKHRADGYEVVELIKALQKDPTTDADDLFRIEWAYLPILDGHHGGRPQTLERRLAADAGFFCEAIRLTFRSKNDADPPDDIPESTRRAALNAYGLLKNWKTPPGTVKDGPFDAAALGSWLEVVQRECLESGHSEIAMEMLGHVLSHAPADPDGLWIHRGAAGVLNRKDAENLRTGFQVELYNSRGVHWVDPTGAGERGLANEYREKADAIELAGFHRLGATLRQMADGYDREAQEMAKRQDLEG